VSTVVGAVESQGRVEVCGKIVVLVNKVVKAASAYPVVTTLLHDGTTAFVGVDVKNPAVVVAKFAIDAVAPRSYWTV